MSPTMLGLAPRPVLRPDVRRSPLPVAGQVEPAAPALVGADGTVLDHGTLRRRVDALAEELDARAAGERLLVHVPMPSTVEAVVGYLAVLEAGHVALVTSADPTASAAVTDAWPVDLAMTAHGTFETSADASPRHLLHPDLALLLSTSGSTGSPKLVRLSHENVLSNAAAIAQALSLTASDRGVTSLPLHYCFGLSVLHSHLTVGASVALTTASVVEEAFWSVVDDHRVTDIAVVPHMVELMETTGVLQRPHPSLRLITQAGGRLAPERVERTARLGAEHGWGLAVMYGQTEATARIAVHDPAAALTAPDAVGRPVPGTQVVLDRDVPEADPHAGTGEVVVRGPGVMMGYAQHPDELAPGPMLTELRTGDLGRLDEDGVLRIVGRRSGFVKVLGLRIDLARVETALEREGLVVCVTGDDDGLRVAVEPVGGTSTTDLSGMARRTAAHACGLGVGHVRVAVLPLARLSNGKVDRAGCDVLVRASDPEECVDARQQMDAPPLQVRVGAALSTVLGRDEIDLARSFVAQGGDSLSHVQASTRLTALLGTLPPDWHHRPLQDLVTAAVAGGRTDQDEQPATGRLARWLGGPVRLETSVVLRALAVVMICGTHAGLFRLLGGAHTLLVVAGYNAALFGLSAATARGRWRGSTRLLVGIAVPTMLVALVGLSYGRYGWDNVLMANWLVDDISYGKHNELWFIDSLLACVLVTTVVLSLPGVSRRWRVDPWQVAFGLVLAGLVPRFLILTFADGVLRGMMPTVFWLFAVGLALATARTVARRRWTLGAMVLGIAWYFPDDPVRNATILAGVLALALLPSIRVPSRLVPAVATLAAASLIIYLVQFQVLDLVPTPPLKTLAALAVGVVVWRWTDAPLRRLADRLVRPRTPACDPTPERTAA
ncbi:AMP-binding protein [Ornithinimicrobium avium]|uniref:AMP-dependent synthetase n=1 Tax=Ornithinimicrobium avium TaxID=2283195 RepID=A0A345NNF2_9MICO|nr:AMP-binding protein [Ornithinimicrobium avium]AXH96560.1 AMP-dependent synthetase [Ornithinimicrobium avium]